MIWHVDYSDDALRDLQGIFDYISLILLEDEVAAKQTERIMDAVDSLDYMPLRYRLFESETWRSRGLRVLPVDNYLILYLPDELKNVVNIVRIMYGGRDIEKHLNDYEQ